MKAVVYRRYGSPDVLHLEEIERPSPGANEVLVKVHAAALNAYDWHLLRAKPFLVRLMGGGVFKPKNMILGADVAGRVEAVGGSVTMFRAGDDVFGDIAMSGGGGLAEYTVAPENRLVPKPAKLSFEEAAAVPMAAVTALQGLRDRGGIRPGQKVLINGASGGVGTFAVQLAKMFGAEVTAVCRADKAARARSLGADHVIDYTKEDFTRTGRRYDLILGVNGYHPISAYKRALAPHGVYVMAGGSTAQIFQAMLLGPLMSIGGGKKMRGVSAKASREDLMFLTGLLKKGKITPVIDRIYPLSDAPDAIRYLEEGHARGKIVVKVV